MFKITLGPRSRAWVFTAERRFPVKFIKSSWKAVFAFLSAGLVSLAQSNNIDLGLDLNTAVGKAVTAFIGAAFVAAAVWLKANEPQA
jgi:hypothetical protein